MSILVLLTLFNTFGNYLLGIVLIYYQILKTKIKSPGASRKENLYVQLGTETLMFTVTEVLIKLSSTIPDWF